MLQNFASSPLPIYVRLYADHDFRRVLARGGERCGKELREIIPLSFILWILRSIFLIFELLLGIICSKCMDIFRLRDMHV